MYKDDAGSNSIVCGLVTDNVSTCSQLMNSFTLDPRTMMPSLFQFVDSAGIVNTARGSDLSLFREVRYRDTSCMINIICFLTRERLNN